MKTLKNLLKSLKDEIKIIKLTATALMFYTSFAHSLTKKDLLNLPPEYRDEFAKNRIEIYKSLSFMQKFCSLGKYLAAQEIHNKN